MPRQYKRRPPIDVIGPSISYVPLTQQQFARIDQCESARVGNHNWYAAWYDNPKDYYAARNVYDAVTRKQSRLFLHVFIFGVREGFTVDHKIPGYALDCRRSNLRHATGSEQAINQRIKSSNTSGCKGVTQRPSGKWRSRISVDGVRILLGEYDLKSEAIAAYCDAAKIYHGEFGRIS